MKVSKDISAIIIRVIMVGFERDDFIVIEYSVF